jgi:hypothetical protein
VAEVVVRSGLHREDPDRMALAVAVDQKGTPNVVSRTAR